MRTDLQVEWGDVELSGPGVRLEVRPEHLPEHTQHLGGDRHQHRGTS